jgi:hypothetical protein
MVELLGFWNGREREGPSPQGWEGEGFSVIDTLTRLRASRSSTLSRGAGEGLLLQQSAHTTGERPPSTLIAQPVT